MKHSVPHSLGKEMARKVTRAAVDNYKSRFAEYSPTATWKTDDQAQIGFSVKGMSLKGGITVTDSTIDLELEVPFLLKPFQGKALGLIQNEINDWIGKAQRGEIQ